MSRTALVAAAAAAAAAALALSACSNVEVSADVDGETQAILDRVAIEDMVVEYYAHLGGDDAGAFDDYFTEDAVFDVNNIVANGRDEIEQIYAGMREEGADNIAAQGTFHMLLSNPVIEVDGDTATAQFVWTGVLNSDIGAAPTIAEQGREYDRLRKVDGKWLFTHRVVIADSGLPEGQYPDWTPRRDFSFDEGE